MGGGSRDATLSQEHGQLRVADPVPRGDLRREAAASWDPWVDLERPAVLGADRRVLLVVGVGDEAADQRGARRRRVELVDGQGQVVQVRDVDGAGAQETE